jgi:hypothetical protein
LKIIVSAVWAHAVIKGPRMKILENITLKEPQPISLSQGAHMSEADPVGEKLFSVLYYTPGSSSVVNTLRTGIFFLYINYKLLIQSKVTFF